MCVFFFFWLIKWYNSVLCIYAHEFRGHVRQICLAHKPHSTPIYTEISTKQHTCAQKLPKISSNDVCCLSVRARGVSCYRIMQIPVRSLIRSSHRAQSSVHMCVSSLAQSPVAHPIMRRTHTMCIIKSHVYKQSPAHDKPYSYIILSCALILFRGELYPQNFYNSIQIHFYVSSCKYLEQIYYKLTQYSE